MSSPTSGGLGGAPCGAELSSGPGGKGVGRGQSQRVRDEVGGAGVCEGGGGEVREKGIICGRVHEHGRGGGVVEEPEGVGVEGLERVGEGEVSRAGGGSARACNGVRGAEAGC